MTSPVLVRVDIVPARATITRDDGTESLTGLRVIVTSDQVFAWRDSTSGPELVFSGRLEDVGGKNTTGFFATTESGRIAFSRDSGCACGSRVRSFQPFAQGMIQGPYGLL